VIDPRTLRGQLGLAYAAALLLVLILFAAATLALVDGIQRATLDERLQTAARAAAAITDQRNGKVAIDANDRAQFPRVVGARLDAAIFDRDRNTVASTVVLVPQAIRDLAARASAGVTTLRSGDVTLRAVRVPVPPGRAPAGAVVVWRDLDDVDDLDHRLALAFAFAIPVVAALAVLAGGAVAARGLRPLIALAQIASEIEAHDLSRRIAIPSRDDELGRLCMTFDRMLDRLQDAFDRERRFTSDASHELRAPLSVIRAEADLMLRRARTPAEYERALRSIAAQADELEALTSDLLAAARGDAVDGAAGPCDLAPVAAAAAKQLEPLARERGITLRRDLCAHAWVSGSESALRRTVVCLLHNAISHARAGGVVTVRVERTPVAIRLSVADDGPGFTPEALVHATERFWRDDPTAPRARVHPRPAGTGLGLSIAEAIVTSAGGTLLLANRPEGGALVVAAFPVHVRVM
jgi:signal transduction histidine kinase